MSYLDSNPGDDQWAKDCSAAGLIHTKNDPQGSPIAAKMPALPPTHNPWHHVPTAKEEDQKSPSQKTADVCPPRRSPKTLEIHNPREEL